MEVDVGEVSFELGGKIIAAPALKDGFGGSDTKQLGSV